MNLNINAWRRLVDNAVFPYVSNRWTDHYQIFKKIYKLALNLQFWHWLHIHDIYLFKYFYIQKNIVKIDK